jgi:hypothetical protein
MAEHYNKIYHGYGVYFRQSINGVEIEFFSDSFKSTDGAVEYVKKLDVNLNAFVREGYFPFPPVVTAIPPR